MNGTTKRLGKNGRKVMLYTGQDLQRLIENDSEIVDSNEKVIQLAKDQQAQAVFSTNLKLRLKTFKSFKTEEDQE